VPPATRGRDGGPGYLSDPALTPAGAWTGTGHGAPGRDPLTSTGWTGNSGPGSPGSGWTGNGTDSSDPRTNPGRNGNGAHRHDPLTSKNWNANGAPGRDPLTSTSWNGNGSPYPPPGPGGPATNGLASWRSMAPAAPGRPGGNGYAGRGSEFDTPAAGIGRRRQAGRRSGRKQRVPTRAIFSELADLAAIPRSAYALEQEADGAMCLLRTQDGFEVFSAADGARHEVRTFEDEEAAYFYLFGVLAAEAVRNRSLLPPR
jgi:hypothetical protein